jgi:hypothetical protein
VGVYTALERLGIKEHTAQVPFTLREDRIDVLTMDKHSNEATIDLFGQPVNVTHQQRNLVPSAALPASPTCEPHVQVHGDDVLDIGFDDGIPLQR